MAGSGNDHVRGRVDMIAPVRMNLLDRPIAFSGEECESSKTRGDDCVSLVDISVKGTAE